MKHLLSFFIMLIFGVVQTSSFAQTMQDDVGTKLPLVTVGSSLGWFPSDDEAEFTLPEHAWVRLSIYSPSIDANEIGDELYGLGLTSTFTFGNDSATLKRESFQMSPSAWLVFYEGPLDAARYVLKSDVEGNGKNVYLLKLETSLPNIPLQGYSTTINVSSHEWSDAFIFNLSQTSACGLELYDGDGASELEVRLIQPTGFIQTITVSSELQSTQQALPRLQGVYTVQLRLPATALQKTNSVRFVVTCAGTPQLVTLASPLETDVPIKPIEVSVVDTDGNVLELPYAITGEFNRDVTLADVADYRLIDVVIENGTGLAERIVHFSIEGGKVTFILEKLTVQVPVPSADVEVVPAQPLPLPEPTTHLVPRLEPSHLRLTRTVSADTLLPCQTLSVTLTIQNEGSASEAYNLREMIPPGYLLLQSNNAMVTGTTLVWRGVLEAGQEVIYHYDLETTPAAQSLETIQGHLESKQGFAISLQSLYRYDLITQLALLSSDGVLRVGDEASYELTIDNPLTREVVVNLQPHVSGMTLLELPESATVPAQSSARVMVKAQVEAADTTMLQVTPFACDTAARETYAASSIVERREEIAALPELPQPHQSTTVTVDMAAYKLPMIDGLVLVQALPDGVHYVAGSTLVDGESAPDPRQTQTQESPEAARSFTVNADGSLAPAGPGSSLVFELPEKSIATLSFTVIHTAPYEASRDDSTLIVLTPTPEVLMGKEDALRYYQEAIPIDTNVAVRERVGAVILSPANGTVIRSGSSTTIEVDTPLDDEVKLFVNDKHITDDRIGTKILDSGIGRQTFEYIGLPLHEGRNVVRLESVAADGTTLSDEIEVYLAGVPDLITLTPLNDIVADSATPLEFELRVEDAWGNAPIDSFVTLEIENASPSEPDADAQQAGYQIAFVNGTGLLRLEPLTEPKEIRIRAVIGRELGYFTFNANSNLRDWIVDGYGNVGANVGAGGFKFGMGGSAFARGRIFNDYLLTFAANYPLEPLGYFGADPLGQAYLTFPVTGSSNGLNQDAYSQQGVYARLERDKNFVQYGDFVTTLDGSLLSLTRPYTGLNFDYNADREGFGVRGYAAYTKPSDRVADLYIKSDGTRQYQLPDNAIKLDTLQLEIVKGDCATPRDFVNDNDPLLRSLRQGVDYMADQSGILRLAFRLPLTDENSECYYLKTNYQLEPNADTARRMQFGVQGTYNVNTLSLRAGMYQETLLDNFAGVIAAGARLESDTLTGDVEVAYGQTRETGGLAATLRLGYRQNALSSEVSYRYFATGYRSAVITDASSAGHELKLAASYALTTNFILSADAQWREYAEDGSSQLESSVLATYTTSGNLQVGDTLLARNPAFQLGVQYTMERDSDSGIRGVAGVSLKDIFGLNRTEVGIVHRQGFATSSTTDFSVAYQILDNLSLRVTDRVVWGNSNHLLFGIEAGFENDDLLGSVCDAIGCLTDPSIPLGTTRVTAQYELGGGIDGDVGRAQLGVDTEVPVTDKLTVTAGASQSFDFSDGSKNETVLSAGASFNEPDVIQAEIANDLRFGVTVKNVYFAGATFKLADDVYGNTTIDYLYDGGGTPRHGFKFAVAFAYRGERINLLANQVARLGRYAESSGSELTGDTRLNYQLNETWSLRTGYLYDTQPELGFRDMTSLGVTGNLWQGGSLTAYGRLFHNWSDGSLSLGGTLEASQELACGVYGVGGVNLFDGTGENYGGSFGEPGVFLRFDIVFDEQWTCGAGSISGQTFVDLNADGIRDDDEVGLAGLAITLLSNDGKPLKTTYAGEAGHYSFGNLKPDRYILEIELPNNYQFSPLYAGADKTRDSNIHQDSGRSEVLELGWQQHLRAIDIGIIRKWE